MILLVNQHTVPVFVDVANAFSSAGHDVRLFTGHVEHGRVPLTAGVRRIQSIRYGRRSTIRRFGTWMMFSAHYFLYLLFCNKPSHILVVSNPPMGPFVTALVSTIRNIPFHILVFDLYPEALQQAGMTRDGSWIYRLWQRNNRWTFSKARGLITLSESMKNAVVKYCDPQKVRINFNWADIEYVKPIDKAINPFIATHHLAGKFVVMYAGNMGLTHDLESLIGAARFLSANKNICFVLIGDGGKRKKLELLTQQANLDNVLFLPYQSPEQFPLAMAAADIGIITLGTGAEGISVPSKTYVNMAAGLAIIAISPPDSELNRIVEHYSIGYVVEPGEPEKIGEHIRTLASNPELLHKFRSNSRAASLNFTSANAREYVRCLFAD